MIARPSRWRWLQQPWVTAVLLVLLGGDFARLYRDNIGVGAAVRNFMVPSQEFPMQVVPLYFHRAGGKLVELFRDGESADEFSKLLRAEPQNVLAVSANEPEVYGLWVPFLRVTPVDIRWMDQTVVDDATRQRIISELAADRAASWEKGGHPEVAKEVREFPLGSSRILWSGVIHNLVVLVIGASLIVSFGWMPRWMRSLRRQPWQCRRCGYDLRGSDGSKCPECGGQSVCWH